MISLSNAGDLRHVVLIKTATLVTDSVGSVTETEATYHTARAAIWPVSAKELVQNAALQGQITHKIRIRYKSGVTPGMRVLFGARYFDIIGPPINPEERNVYLDLMCREVVR